jgi:pimeloyl-ACP methyl ester carboxylesterase
LVVFPACGHTPQEECTDAFLVGVIPFLKENQDDF